MAESAHIAACGFIDAAGWGNAAARHAWPDGAAVCPRRLSWRLFSDSPMERFARLDMLSQYAMIAAEMCIGGAAQAGGDERTAIVLTTTGCLAADLEFLAGVGAAGGASPTWFSYTLPSTAIAEVAIRWQLKGPSLCLLRPPNTGELGLWECFDTILHRQAPRCLCIVADAMPVGASPLLPPGYRPDLAGRYAYAFLIENGSHPTAPGAIGVADIRAGAQTGADRAATRQSTRTVAGDLCRFLICPHDEANTDFRVPSTWGALIVTKAANNPPKGENYHGPAC